MKITTKILHIPPYISTTWSQVRTLFLKQSTLVICLSAGTTIEIPNLDPEALNIIFQAHSNFLEENPQGQQDPHSPFHLSHTAKPQQAFHIIKNPTDTENDPSLSFGLGTFDSLGSALHHNPTQANMPDLPKEILSKISAIAKIVAPDDCQALPKPEPHCNCMHCQIAKAIQQGMSQESNDLIVAPIPEEEVPDSDLTFQQWDITQAGEKLFNVTNRLDTQERFSVYLGDPVGCTCGKQGCEHILAVLKS